jgi:hypothetical protein
VTRAHRIGAAATGLLAAAVLALPLAGCGQDKKAAYSDQARRAAATFKRSAEAAAVQLQHGSRLQDKVPGVHSFRASVDRLASDFAALDPPKDLEQLNGEAVSEMRALSRDLGRYESAARAGDEQQARRLAPTLQGDQAQLQGTLDQIDRKVAE